MGTNFGWISLLCALLYSAGLEFSCKCFYGFEIARLSSCFLNAIETEKCTGFDFLPTSAICQTEIDGSLHKQENDDENGFWDLPSFAHGVNATAGGRSKIETAAIEFLTESAASHPTTSPQRIAEEEQPDEQRRFRKLFTFEFAVCSWCCAGCAEYFYVADGK